MNPRQSSSHTRRLFMQHAAAIAAVPLLGSQVRGAVAKRIAFNDNPFTLGVASGDPSPDGFVLWTRLAPKPVEGGGMPVQNVQVQWRVAEDDAMKKVVREGTTIATPQLAHSVHVELAGLQPDRWYWYDFKVAGYDSPVGRTRTAPAYDALPQKMRFAFASCQHYEGGYFTAFQHMARQEQDLIVHLGDYIYEGGVGRNGVRRHNGPEIVSLADYRNRHALYKTDPDLQAAHAACPWLVTWDDHEFDNNYAAHISEQENIDVAEFLNRRANAYQAYYENMPLRAKAIPNGPDMRLYRLVRFGRLAEFNVLDTRQYRSDQPNGDGRKPQVDGALDPMATLLGVQQERWLSANLLRSQAEWNILAQQVMIGRVDRAPGSAKEYSMDQWPGYKAAADRLLGFLHERRVSNPVVLTGDIHSNYANDIKLDFDNMDSPTVATEFVGTSISSGGDGKQLPEVMAGIMSENPFVKFYNAERGYVQCTVTPEEWKTDYQVVEYVTKPGAPLVTRVSFAVENGRPGLQKA